MANIGGPSVTGLNLEDPSSAPFVIKTWDDRLDQEQFVESGVDDDVSGISDEIRDGRDCC